jgi:exodeoxyribonuclease III
MRICTYNVNSVRARQELLLKWLEKRGGDIDILCLQELKVTDDKFPLDVLAGLGYHSAVFGQPRYNGVAICSREEPQGLVRGFQDEYWDQQKRMIHCRIGGITIINVYAPRGGLPGEEKYHYKQQWYAQILKDLQDHFNPDEPILLAGDLNVALTDLDVYDPQLLQGGIGTLPEERSWLQALLDWGFVDGFRRLYPEQRGYTWWDYVGGGIWQDQGMRIDYLLCTEVLARRLRGMEVDLWPRRRRTPTPSDHAPVIAVFDD